ncbi:MAG: MFS transporter, partial [Chloroflexota bacterium]|nr:MFS transporter [Chloroflexota bacterium]
MSRRDRLLLLGALSGGALLVGVELLITAVALPAILADLAGWTELRRASWIVNGYALTYIATMPLAGRAADRYGLPRLFILALAVFAVGSVLSGLAQTLD